MPITYNIDTEAGVVFVNWHGDVSLQELERHYNKLLNDENFTNIPRAFTDLRYSKLIFTSTEFWKTIDNIYRDAVEKKLLRVAILVANEEHNKYAGIWKTLMPKTVSAAIFYDPIQASAWLNGD